MAEETSSSSAISTAAAAADAKADAVLPAKGTATSGSGGESESGAGVGVGAGSETAAAAAASSSAKAATGVRPAGTPAGVTVSDLDRQIAALRRCEYLKESEVKAICSKAREILVDESNVQRVDAPVTVSDRRHASLRNFHTLF